MLFYLGYSMHFADEVTMWSAYRLKPALVLIDAPHWGVWLSSSLITRLMLTSSVQIWNTRHLMAVRILHGLINQAILSLFCCLWRTRLRCDLIFPWPCPLLSMCTAGLDTKCVFQSLSYCLTIGSIYFKLCIIKYQFWEENRSYLPFIASL